VQIAHLVTQSGEIADRATAPAPRAVLNGLHEADPECVTDATEHGRLSRWRDSWLRQHAGYWQRTCAARRVRWSEQHELVVERFRVVWPAGLAD
jgi:hypothetical protein